MKRAYQRFFGFSLVLLASASLLITLFAIIQVWRVRQPATATLQSGLEVISTTLQTTADVLNIADQSLETVYSSTVALENAVTTLAKAIDETTPLVNALTLLMRDDLPGAISSARLSLNAAQEGAKIIDAVLRVLTTFNPQAYNPDVPLHTALGQVSDSLKGLPQSLSAMESSLSATQSNLSTMKDQINQIARNLHAINANLSHTQQVISHYQDTIATLQTRLAYIQVRLPFWVNLTAWGITFVLVWLGVAQIGLLLQGWEFSGIYPGRSQ